MWLQSEVCLHKILYFYLFTKFIVLPFSMVPLFLARMWEGEKSGGVGVGGGGGWVVEGIVF